LNVILFVPLPAIGAALYKPVVPNKDCDEPAVAATLVISLMVLPDDAGTSNTIEKVFVARDTVTVGPGL
jgi:hypothetical protein